MKDLNLNFTYFYIYYKNVLILFHFLFVNCVYLNMLISSMYICLFYDMCEGSQGPCFIIRFSRTCVYTGSEPDISDW